LPKSQQDLGVHLHCPDWHVAPFPHIPQAIWVPHPLSIVPQRTFWLQHVLVGSQAGFVGGGGAIVVGFGVGGAVGCGVGGGVVGFCVGFGVGLGVTEPF